MQTLSSGAGWTWLAAGLRLQYLPQFGLDCRQDESDRPAGPGQGQEEEAGGGGGGDDEGPRGQSNEVRAGQPQPAEPGPARGDRQVSQQQSDQPGQQGPALHRRGPFQVKQYNYGIM